MSPRPLSLALLVNLAACEQTVYDDIPCDPSLGEADFSAVVDWQGDWCSAEGSRRFSFDTEGRLRRIDPAASTLAPDGVDTFGCEPGAWPLVLGESTTKGGEASLGGQSGPNGNGMVRILETAQISEGSVFLVHRSTSPEYDDDEYYHALWVWADDAPDTLNYFYRSGINFEEAPTIESLMAEPGFEDYGHPLVRCEN